MSKRHNYRSNVNLLTAPIVVCMKVPFAGIFRQKKVVYTYHCCKIDIALLFVREVRGETASILVLGFPSSSIGDHVSPLPVSTPHPNSVKCLFTQTSAIFESVLLGTMAALVFVEHGARAFRNKDVHFDAAIANTTKDIPYQRRAL